MTLCRVYPLTQPSAISSATPSVMPSVVKLYLPLTRLVSDGMGHAHLTRLTLFTVTERSWCYEMRVVQAFSWMIFCLCSSPVRPNDSPSENLAHRAYSFPQMPSSSTSSSRSPRAQKCSGARSPGRSRSSSCPGLGSTRATPRASTRKGCTRCRTPTRPDSRWRTPPRAECRGMSFSRTLDTL